MEGQLSISILVLFVCLSGITYILLSLWWMAGIDGREPPAMRSKIPFLGHVIALLWQGSLYFVHISAHSKVPISTILIWTGRIYVVNDARLASIIQRKSDIFSFDPFVIMAAERLAGTTSEGMKLVKQDLASGHLEPGLALDVRNRMHKYLTSRSSLECMSREMFRNITVALQGYGDNSDCVINLSSWIKYTMSITSTNTIYGPLNPFATDSKVYDAFWDYENNLSTLLLNILPKFTAARAYNGRETLAKAFTRYFEEGHWSQGSDLIQASYHGNTRYDLSIEDQARFELTTCIGLLVNTVPVTLWMLYHIISDPELLQGLRSEILANTTVESDNGEYECKEVRLSITALRDCCPLLNSTLSEILRYHSTSLSARIVTKDTTLNGQYILRGGSLVQIPAAVLHRDPYDWGSEATRFDAARFCLPTNGPERPAAAFRAFGGGSSLCPGRRFARIEIMMFVSIFFLQFDAEPVAGAWAVPKSQYVNVTNSVEPPPKELRVKLTSRERIKIRHAGIEDW